MAESVCVSCRAEEARYRGLCGPCFRAAARMVKAGITNWATLEAHKRARPASISGRRGRRRTLDLSGVPLGGKTLVACEFGALGYAHPMWRKLDGAVRREQQRLGFRFRWERARGGMLVIRSK